MTILCIILAAFMLHSYGLNPGTATGSFTGLFVKVSRHPTRFLAVFSRFNRLMVIYTTFLFKAVKKAYRVFKIRFKRGAPPKPKPARHEKKFSLLISATAQPPRSWVIVSVS